MIHDSSSSSSISTTIPDDANQIIYNADDPLFVPITLENINNNNVVSSTTPFQHSSSFAFTNSGLSNANISELLDISDLFDDDFFPQDLCYSPSMFTARSLDSTNIFSEEQPSKFEETAQVKNDVILIPPKMPYIPTSNFPGKSNVSQGFDNGNGQTISMKTEGTSNKRRIDDSMKGIGGADSMFNEYGGEWKVERRERNREHAKRSRIRKRLLLDSLQDQFSELRNENLQLRRVIESKLPHMATTLLSNCTTIESSLFDSDAFDESRKSQKPIIQQSAKLLIESDYRLIQSLVISQQNFVISDPLLPDNPIVYASDGFCKMTGYKLEEVLGRNCRFLQGPGTDQAAVNIIRQGVIEGRDISVCLLNFKADQTPFWNQFFLAALKDEAGRIVNYVGVQCEVNNTSIPQIKDRVKKMPIPANIE